MESYDYYKNILKGMLSEKRLYHSVCVAEQAAYLAGHFGADIKKAEIAGLLHDICKEMPVESQLQYLKSHDILLNDAILDNKGAIHGITGSVYLKHELGIDNSEILSAVYYHTIGRGNMSNLEKTIYLADYTSADRTYPDLSIVKELVITNTNRAILEGIMFGLNKKLRKGRLLVADTVNAYNYYVKRIRK